MSRIIKTYSELINLQTFEERYEYLRLGSVVGESTFGYDRYLNQTFYRSERWRRHVRNKIILRDDGCDLGHADHPLNERIYIHHINPLTIEDIEADRSTLYDPENLICVSFGTHQAIHYGDASLLPKPLVVRTPGDTCLWKSRRG